jgi:hypothetical protein
VAALLVRLVARIRAEERLLREHFGAEHDACCKRTWRLVPGFIEEDKDQAGLVLQRGRNHRKARPVVPYPKRIADPADCRPFSYSCNNATVKFL